MIQEPKVGQNHFTDGAMPSISVFHPHSDGLLKREVCHVSFGLLEKRLLLLRRVDSIQPDTFRNTIVQDGNGVAVCDRNN